MSLMLLAEQLVGEARERRGRPMPTRQTVVAAVSAGCFVVVASLAAAFLPTERSADPLLIAGLVGTYAIISRVRFEFGIGYVTLEQLAFIPMLMLVPLPLIPAIVAISAVLGMIPDFVSGSWARDRWVTVLSDSWFCIGPVLVLALLAPGEPTVNDVPIYGLALAAQFAGDLTWGVIRDRLGEGLSLEGIVTGFIGTVRFDALIAPAAFFIGLGAVEQPWALAGLIPLVLLLELFSQERRERFSKTLELHRAYRGVVMVLSDVIEQDDSYTADHSRSLVDLVSSVADELGVADGMQRQELEFAALLHDVGKIAIPDEILNKPGPLSDREFEIMKTHTIEGQFLLDRVGGLMGEVGEIVRSSHERWDGSGYPDGLAGENIPLSARIVSACDAYHAMITNRVYRPARSPEAALSELAANSGTQFDPRVVSSITKVVEQLEPARSLSRDARAEASGAVGKVRTGVAA